WDKASSLGLAVLFPLVRGVCACTRGFRCLVPLYKGWSQGLPEGLSQPCGPLDDMSVPTPRQASADACVWMNVRCARACPSRLLSGAATVVATICPGPGSHSVLGTGSLCGRLVDNSV